MQQQLSGNLLLSCEKCCLAKTPCGSTAISLFPSPQAFPDVPKNAKQTYQKNAQPKSESHSMAARALAAACAAVSSSFFCTTSGRVVPGSGTMWPHPCHLDIAVTMAEFDCKHQLWISRKLWNAMDLWMFHDIHSISFIFLRLLILVAGRCHHWMVPVYL